MVGGSSGFPKERVAGVVYLPNGVTEMDGKVQCIGAWAVVIVGVVKSVCSCCGVVCVVPREGVAGGLGCGVVC